jgi:hypothetical protein
VESKFRAEAAFHQRDEVLVLSGDSIPWQRVVVTLVVVGKMNGGNLSHPGHEMGHAW